MTFAEFESITSGERSEQNQLSLWKGLYTALKIWRQVPTAGAFPCQPSSLYFIPHSTGPAREQKEKKKKKKAAYAAMIIWHDL